MVWLATTLPEGSVSSPESCAVAPICAVSSGVLADTKTNKQRHRDISSRMARIYWQLSRGPPGQHGCGRYGAHLPKFAIDVFESGRFQRLIEAKSHLTSDLFGGAFVARLHSE